MGYLITSAVATTAKPAADITFAVLLVVLTIAVLITAVWLIAKFINAPKGKNVVKFVVISIAVGSVLRLLTAIFIGGYRNDFTVYNRMIEHFMNFGISGYYAQYGADVYPLTYYVFALFGGLGRIFGIKADSAYLSIMVKLPFIIADVITAVLLYKIAKRFANAQTGAVLAGVYSLCPLFITASGIWGSTITLIIPFIVASFYFLTDKKHFAAMLLYALAMLTAKEALYLFPMYLIYYGYLFVRSIVKNAKDKKPFAEAVKDSEYSLCYKIPVYFIGLFLLQYIVTLPLIVKDFNGNPFSMIYHIFLVPVANLSFFSYNGLSIFNIFGKNAEALNSSFPSVVFTVCFALLIAGIVAVVYFSKKNRAVLPLLAAYVYFTLSTYFLDSTALSVLPVTALLLLSFIYIKDRRILQVFCLATISCVSVSLAAMVNAGYLNMMGTSSFAAPEYVGSPALTEGFGLVVVIFFSVISVAAHLYMTLVTFDITMSNNRKLMNGNPNAKYFEGVKYLFK